MSPAPALANPDDDDHEEAEAIEAGWEQADEARRELGRPVSDFLRLPWPSVDKIVGGIAPGTVGMLAGYSGNGKTTFLTNLCDQLMVQQNRTIYYLPLETSAGVIRTQFACLRLGLDPGAVLSGETRSYADWEATKAKLIDQIHLQRGLRDGSRLLVGSQRHVDYEGLSHAARDAELAGADLLVVDHIDHLADASYEDNVKVVRHLLALSIKHKLRVLAATQLNQASTAGDRLLQYKPPAPSSVKMGAHKREISHWMLGVYRPTAKNVSKEDVAAVRADQLDVASILAKNTMAVVCMKNRHRGSLEGAKALLWIGGGVVRERTSFDDAVDKMRQRREEEK